MRKRCQVGLHRAVQRAHQPLVAEEVSAQRIRRDQLVHAIVDLLQPLEVAQRQRLDAGEVHALVRAIRAGVFHRASQGLRQLGLVAHRVGAATALAVDGERLLQ